MIPPQQTTAALPAHVPVVIAGGGPVGLTVAALLSSYGVRSVVIEADDAYCSGSRAICMSRRSQEILGWVGADRPLVEKGLSWVGGRSFFRNRQVLHFQMPSEPTQRFAPMVNIQQFYVEEYAHRAIAANGGLSTVFWGHRVAAVRSLADGTEVDVETGDGVRTISCDWLVACDGGRSTVREQLGLQLEGTQYDGKYVIVDIVQKTRREVERLAWFDPPSNPSSTILMHRQPDDVWRIDYQIRDDEDPVEAVKPENVLPRVQSHLDMIGETEPWQPLWISIYNAKCLSLPRYREGRVLFAGDAAHLVPIFGVRGLNSGLDDAGNLAWKLALVIAGRAAPQLLDSYSQERVHATRENIAYGAKSTEFMAPPDFGFRLLRDAALRLAGEDERVRALVNPRQSTAIEYVGSPLNNGGTAADDAAFGGDGAHAGMPAPEARVTGVDGVIHLTNLFGRGFTLLCFGGPEQIPATLSPASPVADVAALQIVCIADHRTGNSVAARAGVIALSDASGQAHERYAAAPGTLYLIRPDGYVLARWHHLVAPSVRAAQVRAAMQPFTGERT